MHLYLFILIFFKFLSYLKVDADVNNDIVSALNSSFNYEELCAAFICLYFSAGLNKSQFAKVLEFSSITTSEKIPKSFNECTNTLLTKFGEKIIIDKNWYCSKCKDFVILKDQYQRTCLICGNSLANYIYLPLENQLLKLVKKFPNVSLMGCLINHTSKFLILF
jgi:hypothetical protein